MAPRPWEPRLLGEDEWSSNSRARTPWLGRVQPAARSAASQHGPKQPQLQAHWALLGPTFKAENLLTAPHRLVFADLTQNFALRSSYFQLVGLLPERLFELHRDLASKLGFGDPEALALSQCVSSSDSGVCPAPQGRQEPWDSGSAAPGCDCSACELGPRSPYLCEERAGPVSLLGSELHSRDPSEGSHPPNLQHPVQDIEVNRRVVAGRSLFGFCKSGGWGSGSVGLQNLEKPGNELGDAGIHPW